MFSFLNIPTDTEAIKHAEPSKAEALLMKSVEDHFQSAVIDPTQRIRRTNASPLYFQHVGKFEAKHKPPQFNNRHSPVAGTPDPRDPPLTISQATPLPSSASSGCTTVPSSSSSLTRHTKCRRTSSRWPGSSSHTRILTSRLGRTAAGRGI